LDTDKVTGKVETDPSWRRKYRSLLVFNDSLVIIFSGFFAFNLRFDSVGELFLINMGSGESLGFRYVDSLLAFSLLWLYLLSLMSTRGGKVIGGGAREYSLVAQASLVTLTAATLLLFTLDASFSRQMLFVFFGLGLPLLVLERWVTRRFLNRQRHHAGWRDNVVLIGRLEAVSSMAVELRYRYQAGLHPVAACITDGFDGKASQPLTLAGLTVFRDVSQARSTMETSGSVAALLVEGGGLSPLEIKSLSWQLDSDRHELILASGLLDVSGPRIQTRPVAGMPLMYVEVPNFQGFRLVAKRLMDIVLSTVATIILSPVYLAIAVAIKLDDGGPIFFSQKRVGLDNTEFRILKFRSMSLDAEKLKQSLVGNLQPDSPLFKIKFDPRVTHVGAFLRKWSLDEIPQLLNVLVGHMSLVGPRPPLQSEVDQYETHVSRKFLVKPGITGLWQVSGRSNLSWEESVRLDLSYVENWSIIGDTMILLRTVLTVLRRDGAY
jgi:exopolysaccharide biosynthesis polyprenyl glycosylphosphotransferase